eukprot:362322-Chlamydomonas_euryale.AAC.22
MPAEADDERPTPRLPRPRASPRTAAVDGAGGPLAAAPTHFQECLPCQAWPGWAGERRRAIAAQLTVQMR